MSRTAPGLAERQRHPLHANVAEVRDTDDQILTHRPQSGDDIESGRCGESIRVRHSLPGNVLVPARLGNKKGQTITSALLVNS